MARRGSLKRAVLGYMISLAAATSLGAPAEAVEPCPLALPPVQSSSEPPERIQDAKTPAASWAPGRITRPAIGCSSDPEIELHVDANSVSSDPGEGTEENPFKTPAEAQAKIRDLRLNATAPYRPVVVLVHAGDYLKTKLVLRGEQDSCVTWRNFQSDQVRLIGGVAVTGMNPVPIPQTPDRIQPLVRGNISYIDLFSAFPAPPAPSPPFKSSQDFGRLQGCGSASLQRPGSVELFFDDRPMQLARWPNEGKPGEEWALTTIDKECICSPSHLGFFYDTQANVPNDPSAWTVQEAPNRPWVFGYWTTYQGSYQEVTSIQLAPKSCNRPKVWIQTTANTVISEYGAVEADSGPPPYPWYGINILEELDRPEEWYLDRSSGRLYFYPPGGKPVSTNTPALLSIPDPSPCPKTWRVGPEETGCEAPSPDGTWKPAPPDKAFEYDRGHILTVKETHDVTIQGLIVEVARDSAITIWKGQDNLVIGCTLRNAGRYGVEIHDSNGSGVRSSDIYHTNGGVLLEGNNMFARNNRIYDFSRWCRNKTEAVKLSQGLSPHTGGGVAEHNCIRDGAGPAIVVSNPNHLVQFNDISAVVTEAGDRGAIQITQGENTLNTLVRHNYVGDLRRQCFWKKWTRNSAVYMDDYASGSRICGNLFRNLDDGIWINGGKCNWIEKNLFHQIGLAVKLNVRENFVPTGGMGESWNEVLKWCALSDGSPFPPAVDSCPRYAQCGVRVRLNAAVENAQVDQPPNANRDFPWPPGPDNQGDGLLEAPNGNWGTLKDKLTECAAKYPSIPSVEECVRSVPGENYNNVALDSEAAKTALNQVDLKDVGMLVDLPYRVETYCGGKEQEKWIPPLRWDPPVVRVVLPQGAATLLGPRRRGPGEESAPLRSEAFKFHWAGKGPFDASTEPASGLCDSVQLYDGEGRMMTRESCDRSGHGRVRIDSLAEGTYVLVLEPRDKADLATVHDETPR